jgi:hypothetical protein
MISLENSIRRCLQHVGVLGLIVAAAWLTTLNCLAASGSSVSPTLPAFPGAEGFGSHAVGGRGGKVLQVTNLSDYRPGKEPAIPGSLRWACAAAGPRTVVFRVSGTIALKQTLTISEPYLTLAGQTAPGDGICLRDEELRITTHDVIIRHLRVRPGVDRTVKQLDGIGVGNGARDVIIDHCSVSWASDEGLTCNGAVDRVTVQWCLIAEGLGRHGYGSIIGSINGSLSYHHNLYVSNISRLPRPAGFEDQGGVVTWDFRNNVIYNWGHTTGYNGNYGSRPDHTAERGNLVANTYLAGPSSRPAALFRHVVRASKMFAEGNIMNGRAAGWEAMAYANGTTEAGVRVDLPFPFAPVATQTADQAFAAVLQRVGASLPRRDAVDERLLREVKDGGGHLVADAAGISGWPTLASVPPPADRDNDGMPDEWEIRHGLNPEKADHNLDADNDGYTNLEEFLSGTDPRRGEAGYPPGMQHPAAGKKNAHFPSTRQIVFGCATSDMGEFRAFAERAKALGATHITITSEDLPPAWWEMTPPGDPYPAWVITNPGLLKIATPDALKPYVPQAHGEEVMRMLEARCRILRELGLKAAFHTFEPQMLPDPVFSDHPAWRGPRVDHPLRSRTPRFAPSISHPEVLKLYTEAMGRLLDRCPEIEILQMRTSDSGAGVDWSASLYAGASGNRDYQNQPMAERVRGFIDALQRAAKVRGSDLHLHLYNLRDKQQGAIVAALAPGMAVEEQEGPDGSPFKSEVGSLYSGISLLNYRRPFAPACGIPWPVTFLDDLAEAAARKPRRLFVAFGDRHNLDLYLRIYELFGRQTTNTPANRRSLLHQVAVEDIGEAESAKLVETWMALQVAEKLHRSIRGGGTIFILGGVHQRWITRPFVPSPERLNAAETAWWRPHLFQARGEVEANDLMDIQGFRVPEVNGGYDKVVPVFAQMEEAVDRAARTVQEVLPGLSEKSAASYRLLSQRIAVFRCLLSNALHAVEYQRALDGLAWEVGSSSRPSVRDVPAELDRIARAEIENTRRLIALLETAPDGPLIDRAQATGREYQRDLGHDIVAQLRKKIAAMEAHRHDTPTAPARPPAR